MLKMVSEMLCCKVSKGQSQLTSVCTPTDSIENTLHIIRGPCLQCSALPFNMQGILLFNIERYIILVLAKSSFDKI